MTIRLEIAPGDHFDVVVKPFHELTVADHIRLYESDHKDEGANELERAKNRLIRITGAPSRFIRYMSLEEVDRTFAAIEEQTNAHDGIHSQLAKVHEVLSRWKEEHEDADWTIEDARNVIQAHGIFNDRIEVEGRVFTAPLVEPSAFGKWIDLQDAMTTSDGEPESESYVRSLAIMMEGDDGAYPVQANAESNDDYHARCDAYTAERRRLFTNAPWVDVMGCAAFFFSKSQRFAELCGHCMSRFQSLRKHKQRPERRIIPIGGVDVQSFG